MASQRSPQAIATENKTAGKLMSEEKQYMDEQWDDLPLPDGELAWEKMEVLLDKDKKRRIVPLWFWRYGVLGLLLFGLAAGAWMWIRKDKTDEKVGHRTAKEMDNVPAGKAPTTDKIETNKSASTQEEKQTRVSAPTTNDLPSKTEGTGINSPAPIEAQPEKTKNPRQPITNENNQRSGQKATVRTTKKRSQPPATSSVNSPVTVTDSPPSADRKDAKPALVDSAKVTSAPLKDTADKKDTVATKTAEPIVNNTHKKDSQSKKKPFIFTAGVGLQQAIAFAGQESSSFNYKGKQNSLSDRIPSIYLRLQKGAWFAQAEFQYAVPQPVEQFSFAQKTSYDVASLNVNTEQFTIRKLYYHQLPVSVNYFVFPNLSVGAGATYSILAGAVTEQEVTSKNVQTGSESVSRSLAPIEGFKDSFLYKTTAGILVQTDYHWKRFALGLRYTQNLEPFIQYTRPDGVLSNEKNRVLQAILRFRLF
jgi:hypothetical protein